jgi:hypothetical protein
MNHRFVSTIAVVASTWALLPACKGGAEAEQKPAPTAEPAPSAPPPAATPEPPASAAEVVPHGPAIPIFQGPPLLVLPGQGLGPIRFGATQATVERLMEKPCDDQPTAETKVCRYVARAVEFFFDDKGVVREMRVHRADRPVDPDGKRKYGIFRGRTQEGLAPLMLQPAVREMLGPPQKVETVKSPGDANTLEIFTYKGMRVEFDKLPNGNVVVGGIDLTKA